MPSSQDLHRAVFLHLCMSTLISRVASSRSGPSSWFAGSAGSLGMEEERDRERVESDSNWRQEEEV